MWTPGLDVSTLIFFILNFCAETLNSAALQMMRFPQLDGPYSKRCHSSAQLMAPLLAELGVRIHFRPRQDPYFSLPIRVAGHFHGDLIRCPGLQSENSGGTTINT